MLKRIHIGIYLSLPLYAGAYMSKNLTTKGETDYGRKGERMRLVTVCIVAWHMLNTNTQMEHVSNVQTHTKKKTESFFFEKEMLKSSCSF